MRGATSSIAPTKQNHAHFLYVIEGDARGRYFELDGAPFLIGRANGCHLRLADDVVFKRHCMAQLEDDQLYVTDLNSTNGSYLNGTRIAGRSVWPNGKTLRLGRHEIRHEYRDRDEFTSSEQLAADLRRASGYVASLLPQPITAGAVQVDWCYAPSTVLGGDNFGYHWHGRDHFVFYLIDVCGHGVGSALHSVSVLNILRQESLVGADFKQPADVLVRLNSAMQMESHGDMFFSIWYGVYNVVDRSLTFASGGNPPAILLGGDGDPARELNTGGLFLGMLPNSEYTQQIQPIAPGSRLCVLSDGAFELTTELGDEWSFQELLKVVIQSAAEGTLSAGAIHQKVKSVARHHALDDDFSLMILGFE